MTIETDCRKQVLIPSVRLSDGREVTNIPVVYEAWGQSPEHDAPVILLIHALTGSSHARQTPEDPVAGWWEPFMGTGQEAVDLNRYTVIAPNLPGSCYGSWIPDERSGAFLTIADMSGILAAFLHALGVKQLYAVIGGSLGGMVALQFCSDGLIPAERAVLLSCGSRQSSWAKAWGHLGLSAMKNAVNESVGLSLARQIAMLSYRTPPDFNSKDQGDKTVQHYLYYQGTKFVNRFTNWSYELLVRAMDSHLVTRVDSPIRVLIAGVWEDLLYPVADQQEMSLLFRDPVLHFFHSEKGHDAFLTDSDELNPVIRHFLDADIRNHTSEIEIGNTP